jgi:NADPH-dependent ferric siderophore reductase
MTATVSSQLPMVLAEVEVTSVERLSPTFVRVELGGDALADFGVDGKLYDQRIKLVFPNADGDLPSFEGADESWFATWLDIPAEERGHMRTYTIREVRGSGRQTRFVVDFVLHLEDGATGPGSAWAASAAVGDRLVTMAPRRGVPFGGIEFSPGFARSVLLVGDETAVPAISSILADIPAGTRGTAFLEVPVAEDVLDVACPTGMEVVWLPRGDAPLGERLTGAVLAHLGEPVAGVDEPGPDEVDPDLWETPTYSSSGEPLDVAAVTVGHDLDGIYAWIAGESAVVTGLRRHLVNELGMDRRQVAFMGYWRRGVAMRS